ncbi:MAG: hypothetical protein ACC628_28170 [Pirellulaceae bacterium]
MMVSEKDKAIRRQRIVLRLLVIFAVIMVAWYAWTVGTHLYRVDDFTIMALFSATLWFIVIVPPVLGTLGIIYVLVGRWTKRYGDCPECGTLVIEMEDTWMGPP